MTQQNIEIQTPPGREASELSDRLCGEMWEAYGPSRINLTFDYESSVGPTEINNVPGPLCVVSGDTAEDSLKNAKRIADLLNSYGL